MIYEADDHPQGVIVGSVVELDPPQRRRAPLEMMEQPPEFILGEAVDRLYAVGKPSDGITRPAVAG